ncbi:MAG: hypothetical protein R2845_00620 [Thermomicrobiales bacterium]
MLDVNGIKVLAAEVTIESKDAMRQLGDRLRDQLQSGVVVLGSVIGESPGLIAMWHQRCRRPGRESGRYRSRDRRRNRRTRWRTPQLAEAGGKNASGIPGAIAKVHATVEGALKG